MLGKCFISLDGRQIDCFGSAYSKTMKLFLLLAYYGKQGINRQEVLDILYSETDHSNDAGNLRAVSFRLKKQMISAGLLPEGGTITESGMFRWVPENIQVEIDARQFEEAARQALSMEAEGTEEEEELHRAALHLKETCGMYTGDFLLDMVSDMWMAERQVAYQDLWFRCLNRYFDILKKLGHYEEMLAAARNVLRVYPCEEWFLVELDALIAMERWKEVLDAYENAIKSLMDHLGLHPTEELLRRGRIISEQLKGSTRSLQDIRSELEEQEYEGGAYFCGYASFVSVYRQAVRGIERNGQSLYLMMCTLTEKGVKSGLEERDENFWQAVNTLGDSIRASLRRSDCYTRYGANQYLMLLGSIKQEDCPIVFGRIERSFGKSPKTRKYQLHYYIEVVRHQQDFEMSAPLKFGAKNWG